MICNRCGAKNGRDALVCEKCGTVLKTGKNEDMTEQEGEEKSASIDPKKSKGLAVMVATGAIALVAATLYFLFLAGIPVIGEWYNEDMGAVLEFTDNDAVTYYSLEGAKYGTYKYDQYAGKGSAVLDNGSGSFSVSRGNLIFEKGFSETKFIRAEEGFGVEGIYKRPA